MSSRPPVSPPPEGKRVVKLDGSGRPLTSSGKSVTVKSVTSSGDRSATSAARSEKSRPPIQGKPVVTGSSDRSAPKTEKPKQPLNSIKGKEVVRSSEVKKTIMVSKTENKGKAPVSSSKTVTKITKTIKKTRGKTEKKVYTLPGQKHDPPEEREPLRIFYESLSKQIPSSEMAELWMMEHGLLPHDKAKKAYERKQRKPKITTPIKPVIKSVKPETSKKPQLLNNGGTKRKVNYSDDEDDFIVRTKKTRA